MAKPTDIRPVAIALYFLPIKTRVPLKFGPEITTEVTCARVKMTVVDSAGRDADGWGETPLSVQWVWPSQLSYDERHEALRSLCLKIASAWLSTPIEAGHPIEVGHRFIESVLPGLTNEFNQTARPAIEPVPWLGSLVCASAFDLALHDAFGMLHGVPTYETYNDRYMSLDLAHYLTPAARADVSFVGRFPNEFLLPHRQETIPAWHLVGGKDPVDSDELTGSEPDDGYPVLLRDWIRRDGLKCLKVKLRGDDPEWDFDRLLKVGQMAVEEGVDWLTADFNCTVHEPAYVNAILDRLIVEHPRLFGMLLYVEQPFPYDLETHRIDVHSVSARKPLFMDESAHDWRFVRLGRELGWSGVALKTCKTQTGALLSLCWAKAHGMTLMVQDLSNPMLAQITHSLLAAHAGTIMGVESNGMQFYPAASLPEAAVHPGLYRRRNGCLDLSTIRGPGFGYRIAEIDRSLPAPSLESEVPTSSGSGLLTMHDYFYEKFPSQLARLEFRRPNDIVHGQIMRDPSVIFFGGPDWENVKNDLRTVPAEDRSRFVLSLFMVVLTDQALYTHFRDSYDAWRGRTKFPKFGWTGFGPHNENPFKILWAPERESRDDINEVLIDINEVRALVPEFVKFLVDETTTYFREYLPAIDVGVYFDTIRRDGGYAFNQGTVVRLVKAEFEVLTNG